jgi:hypothetical protein
MGSMSLLCGNRSGKLTGSLRKLRQKESKKNEEGKGKRRGGGGKKRNSLFYCLGFTDEL